MDFDDTPEQIRFRQECVEWLQANASRRTDAGSAETWRMLRPRTEADDAAGLVAAKKWQARKAEAGFAGITWPAAYGGRDLSPQLAAIFKVEESHFDVPANAFQ